MHSICLLSLLRTRAFGWAFHLRLIEARQHVLFPLSLEFSAKLLGFLCLLFVTVEATIIEDYRIVVVIVFAFPGSRLGLHLTVWLIWTLGRLVSPALALYDMIRVNISICILL